MEWRDDLEIGLQNWHRSNLAPLSHTPFRVAEAAWIGQPLLDCHGRTFARVRDVLVESRCAEETRGGPGVRAAYLVAVAVAVAARPWRSAPALYLPVDRICNTAGQLRVSEDAAELWLGLFGRELPHA
jgi:hypothetical protein